MVVSAGITVWQGGGPGGEPADLSLELGLAHSPVLLRVSPPSHAAHLRCGKHGRVMLPPPPSPPLLVRLVPYTGLLYGREGIHCWACV